MKYRIEDSTTKGGDCCCLKCGDSVDRDELVHWFKGEVPGGTERDYADDYAGTAEKGQ
jgi:hypothetical protein